MKNKQDQITPMQALITGLIIFMAILHTLTA